MRSLFTNWEEINKFLAKKFFLGKWYMQVKNHKTRDDALEKAMKVIDKKYLTNVATSFGDAEVLTEESFIKLLEKVIEYSSNKEEEEENLK